MQHTSEYIKNRLIVNKLIGRGGGTKIGWGYRIIRYKISYKDIVTTH